MRQQEVQKLISLDYLVIKYLSPFSVRFVLWIAKRQAFVAPTLIAAARAGLFSRQLTDPEKFFHKFRRESFLFREPTDLFS